MEIIYTHMPDTEEAFDKLILGVEKLGLSIDDYSFGYNSVYSDGGYLICRHHVVSKVMGIGCTVDSGNTLKLLTNKDWIKSIAPTKELKND